MKYVFLGSHTALMGAGVWFYTAVVKCEVYPLDVIQYARSSYYDDCVYGFIADT